MVAESWCRPAASSVPRASGLLKDTASSRTSTWRKISPRWPAAKTPNSNAPSRKWKGAFVKRVTGSARHDQDMRSDEPREIHTMLKQFYHLAVLGWLLVLSARGENTSTNSVLDASRFWPQWRGP